MTAPELEELLDTVVVLSDANGQRARFVVDHVDGDTAVCVYVFRSRHRPPTRCHEGDRVELGSADTRGWIVATGTVRHANDQGAVTVAVEDLEILQRRRAYREEIILPFVLREDLSGTGVRGRTDNLSIGGFAARIHGAPLPDGANLIVTFDMPDGTEMTMWCTKISGDLQQRFSFTELDRATEDVLAKLVRTAELSKRRAQRPPE